MSDRILIIGGGITGLSCAATLRAVGFSPIVVDKGRGIGGRLSTRRSDHGTQFDHGAQYITAKTEPFRQFLDMAEAANAVERWDEDHTGWFVGTPGMSSLAKYMGAGIDVRSQIQVTSIRNTGQDIHVFSQEDTYVCDRLVVAIPAPQARQLLVNEDALTEDLGKVEMMPCLTLMAAFQSDVVPHFKMRRREEDALSWIVQDSHKPSRQTKNCWVAQANPTWSKIHLEENLETLAQTMLPLLCEQIGIPIEDNILAISHRWRYATASKMLGKQFLKTPSGQIYVGGDWCCGARVESAWMSGTAIAKDILGSI